MITRKYLDEMKTHMNNLRSRQLLSSTSRYVIAILFGSILLGCGQKGPLVLPEQTPSNQQNQDNNDNQEQE